ncbi:MAG: DUF5714 domain-containing protein [Acidobacteriota bacterium]
MIYKTGCLVCGKSLQYSGSAKPLECYYCGNEYETNAACAGGHYVCDTCHSASADDLIERYCMHASSTEPIKQAVQLMKNRSIKMHGPEHHFLVPAVLFSAYSNLRNLPVEEKKIAIKEARKRAELVKGGFCGFHGTCGAAVGTGIFVSILSKATPLAKTEWRLSNRMTAESLKTISEFDGPRCCKRDSFLAIIEAVDFLKNEFDVEMMVNRQPVCEFEMLNKECHKENCPFFKDEMVH